MSSNAGKADPTTRSFIRSHVMRGKNKKSRGTKQGIRLTSGRHRENRNRARPVDPQGFIDMYIPLPTSIGSDTSLVDLDIDPTVLLNLIRVSEISGNLMFPLMTVVGFQPEKDNWLDLLRDDPAGLHITAFAMEELVTKVIRRETRSVNVVAMQHFQKGVKILRERLLGDEAGIKISDSTMGVVLKLAGAAHFHGDYQSSKHHMDGLRRIADLRGGLDAFKGTRLRQEMLRCDLMITLLNGSPPTFFRQPSEPIPAYPEALLRSPDELTGSLDNIELVQNVDHDLVTAWRVMRKFCLLVNVGTQTKQFIRPETICDTMAAVTYRLLETHFAIGSIDNILKHGLLVFTYHIFLQWSDLKLPYPHFPTAYRVRIENFMSHHDASPQLMLWLLMIGAISIFDAVEDSWLRREIQQYVEKCGVRTWKDMRDVLKSFMWIGLLDDRAGQDITKSFGLD
ncbi:hypothetical protein FHL15_002616 [Xylaria flabelliformis]|uniref:Transcription factor domain-containing protein n=1 Tax=Xylaria flabelliformis TaxID=2512241 RepID=A0A553I833_9PEZI|nr:hypothetical protein FHL15_002616 [Xylaria flabelliformis]